MQKTLGKCINVSKVHVTDINKSIKHRDYSEETNVWLKLSVTDPCHWLTFKQKPCYHNLPLRANSKLWHHYSNFQLKKERAFSLVTLPFWVLVPPMQSPPWLQLCSSPWPSLFCPDCQSWHAPASPILPALPGKKWNHKVFNRSDAWRQRWRTGNILVTLEKNSSCFVFIEKSLHSGGLQPQYHTGKS